MNKLSKYKENFLDALRNELVETVNQKLTPLATKYQFSETPLEENIKWRPIVLILGNYSSGKSTFINELIGTEVQNTGQAPTDDNFTVITSPPADSDITSRDGQTLVNDPTLPFSGLRKYGQRFSSHFQLKYVDSQILQDLAIIDTPGMLDSVSERDRGYDYQKVIGEFAQMADLIVVMFDPHKAGTIRETYLSLRETLPTKTFENRVLFTLNRIDECSNLNDLLRVYGTLCWNLSQMTGRKDIPPIHLTYSTASNPNIDNNEHHFLSLLENEREKIKKAILSAPKFRLDHLNGFIEHHAEIIDHFLEALENYKSQIQKINLLHFVFSIFAGLFVAGTGVSLLHYNDLISDFTSINSLVTATIGCISGFALWWLTVRQMRIHGHHRRQL